MTNALNNLNAEELTGRLPDTVKEAAANVKARLNEGKLNVDRAVKRGRRAVEDGIEDAVYQVKRNPLSSVAIAFGAGVGVAAVVLGPALIRQARKNAARCVSEVD